MRLKRAFWKFFQEKNKFFLSFLTEVRNFAAKTKNVILKIPKNVLKTQEKNPWFGFDSYEYLKKRNKFL